MPDFTVAQRGTDTSGRPILASAFFWLVWTAILRDPRLAGFAHKVTVVQGAFMARLGGGARASAGYHDLGGCWDVRTWNLTGTEQALLWQVADEYGLRFWKRDYPAHMGGMDPHGHGVGGWDQPLADGATYQWWQARNDRDGLARNGPDYMHRHHPCVTFPPAHLLEEDYMSSDDARARLTRIETHLASLAAAIEGVDGALDKLTADEKRHFQRLLGHNRASRRRMVSLLGGVADQLTELAGDLDGLPAEEAQTRVAGIKSRILDHLAADPDVDGAENPAEDTL